MRERRPENPSAIVLGVTFDSAIPTEACLVGALLDTIEGQGGEWLAIAEKAATALAGVHVLVVDDEEDCLAVMHTTLECAGASVAAVGSPRAAVKALSRFIPDVILLDLMMPEQDGLSFARDLQRMPSLRAIPILAVTAYDQCYQRRDLHDAGFIGILRKPLVFPDLVEAVRALASVREPNRQT